jgi:hypothetical protein
MMPHTFFFSSGLLLALAVAAASPSGAQSLADTARAAQEATEKNNGNLTAWYSNMPWKMPRAAMDNQEISYFELTLPVVRRYASAHKGVLQAQVDDVALDERITAGVMSAKLLSDLERTYASEPAVMRALQAAGEPAHEYALVEAALAVAVGAKNNEIPLALARHGKVPANVALIIENNREMVEIVRQYEALELALAKRTAAAAAKPAGEPGDRR